MKRAQEKSGRVCVVCGCTEADCRQCVERIGEPCAWDPLFRKVSVCTACSRVFYIATFQENYAVAILSIMGPTEIGEIDRARDFARKLGNAKRAEMLERRRLQLARRTS